MYIPVSFALEVTCMYFDSILFYRPPIDLLFIMAFLAPDNLEFSSFFFQTPELQTTKYQNTLAIWYQRLSCRGYQEMQFLIGSNLVPL